MEAGREGGGDLASGSFPDAGVAAAASSPGTGTGTGRDSLDLHQLSSAVSTVVRVPPPPCARRAHAVRTPRACAPLRAGRRRLPPVFCCWLVQAREDQACKALSPSSFVKLGLLGKGAVGKCYLVRQKGSNTLYAMKVSRKRSTARVSSCVWVLVAMHVLRFSLHGRLVLVQTTIHHPHPLPAPHVMSHR